MISAMRAPAGFTAGAAILALAGCQTALNTPLDLRPITGSPGLQISSSPPGAEVWIDGQDSGFATPCVLALERGDAYRVELVLEGYETALRGVDPDARVLLVPWRDADLQSTHWRFPLWLALDDFLVPVRLDRSLSPSRVHVQMRLAGEP
jgi:hypothetical protein